LATKVTIGKPALFPLTSPPKQPSKKPDEVVYSLKDYGDRQVWVSLPFPDSVELVCDLRPGHLAAKDASDKTLEVQFAELDKKLYDYIGGADVWPKPPHPVTLAKKSPVEVNRSATFFIKYDPDQPLNRATFTLRRCLDEGHGRWTAKLEFSARTAGKAGLSRLIDGVSKIVALSLPKMLPDMRVARLDVAVDCIGVVPIDLIVRVPDPGKRMTYLGDSGVPESHYLFARKPPPKKPPKKKSVRTRGAQRLTLYERRDYLRQLGLKPEFGDAPITRVEVAKRWSKSRPKLSEIGIIKNMFVGRHVAYAAAARTPSSMEWVRFCMAAFGAGVEKAMWLWLTRGGKVFATTYLKCKGDLVSPETWLAWGAGLKMTGLDGWVSLASGSDGGAA
jgi:hypothetical protein